MTLNQMRPQKVQISILGRDFVVACTPDEKNALQNAAKILDTRLKTLRSQGSGAACNFDQLLVVVALNLCNELNSNTVTEEASPLLLTTKKMQDIINKIDNVLHE